MGRIVIDKESCKACNICMAVCPKHLIHPSCDTNTHGVNFAEFKDEKMNALAAQSAQTAALTQQLLRFINRDKNSIQSSRKRQ